MFINRCNKLKQKMKEKDLHFVLITSASNLYYYTGFTGGEAYFLMPAEAVFANTGIDANYNQDVKNSKDTAYKQGVDTFEGTNCRKSINKYGYVITDSRYYEQVEKECPKMELVKLEKLGFCETVKDLLQRIERTILEGSIEQNTPLQGSDSKSIHFNIGIEETMNLSQYLKLKELCDGVDFQVEQALICETRSVKDDEELTKIKKAEAIGDAAFTHILDIIKPGITEAEVSLELEYFMKKNGASKLSFDTIVASGANSSMPHAQVTDRVIQNGDFVTMDFGCVYKGYCSDMTRTIAVGQPTEEMKQVYQIVLDANLYALEAIAIGKKCSEVDAVARNYIKEKGYGAYFGHGLGHGVGIDIHEEPRFSPKCDVILQENMVITDEPGIYLLGKFGVRIEDLVAVTKEGYDKFSNSKKELIII